jgi:hypothetical protein
MSRCMPFFRRSCLSLQYTNKLKALRHLLSCGLEIILGASQCPVHWLVATDDVVGCFLRYILLTMRPPQVAPKASVFSLDLIVHEVAHDTARVACNLPGDNPAIACRFLDYPLIFIRPRCKQREKHTIKFNIGKSCALAEVKACLKDSLQHVRPNPCTWFQLGIKLDVAPAESYKHTHVAAGTFVCTVVRLYAAFTSHSCCCWGNTYAARSCWEQQAR